jgi:hypothetical protein
LARYAPLVVVLAKTIKDVLVSAVGATFVSVGIVAVLPWKASLYTGQRSLTVLALLHGPTLAEVAGQTVQIDPPTPDRLPPSRSSPGEWVVMLNLVEIYTPGGREPRGVNFFELKVAP